MKFNPSNNSDYLKTLQKPAYEVNSCEKQGASVNLSREIEEENRDTRKTKNNKRKTNYECFV